MTGFVGGIGAPMSPESLSDRLYREEWYETTYQSCDDAGVGIVEHGQKDSASNLLWRDGGRLGVLYGVLSNESGRSMAAGDLFGRLLDRPEVVLPKLDGPFAIAAIDADAERGVVATDKVGSRPCYYTADDGFLFSSEISPLVPALETPSVDRQAVGDLLTYGAVFGDKTVLDGIENLPPATALSFESGSVTTSRYWEPDCRVRSTETYVDDWLDYHARAIENLVETTNDDLTLWLSGGIDSRVTAGALRETGRPFDTLTYATGEGGNRSLARAVADRLDVPISEVPTEPDSGTAFVDGVRKTVRALDSMSSWAYVPAIPFLFQNLREMADTTVEGGTFLGEDVFSYYTSHDIGPVETLYRKRHLLSVDEVTAIMTEPVRPRQSLHDVVERAAGIDPGTRSVDAMRQLYANLHMRSNVPMRSQVGTRVVSNGQFLDHVLAMPDRYRLGTVPFTGGDVPLGVSRMKLEAVRGIDQGLEHVAYERSGFPPARPYWLHVLGAGVRKLASTVATSTPSGYRAWYRTDSTVRAFVDDSVADAKARPFFDGDALDRLLDRIDEGRNMVPIAAVVGLELWLQRFVDPQQ